MVSSQGMVDLHDTMVPPLTPSIIIPLSSVMSQFEVTPVVTPVSGSININALVTLIVLSRIKYTARGKLAEEGRGSTMGASVCVCV